MCADTPYCGTEEIEYFEVPDDVTEEELNEQCDEMTYNNAESFEYLATGWDEDFENDDERNNYYDDCFGGWEFITKEEYLANTEE